MVTQVAFSKVQMASGEAQARTTPPRGTASSAPNAAESATRTEAPQANAAEPPSSALKLDTEALEAAVQSISKTAQNLQRSLQFSVDEVSGKTVITVVDKETQEIIRQIPREEILALADHFGHGPGALVETEA